MTLEKGKFYKIIHDNAYGWPRNYIIFSPSETYDIDDEKYYTDINCQYIVNLSGGIVKSNASHYYTTGYQARHCEFDKLNNRDLEDIRRMCGEFGFKYNRKLNKIIENNNNNNDKRDTEEWESL